MYYKAFEPVGHNAFFVGTVKNDFDINYLIYKVGKFFLYVSDKLFILADSILNRKKLNLIYSPVSKTKFLDEYFYFDTAKKIDDYEKDTIISILSDYWQRKDSIENEKK